MPSNSPVVRWGVMSTARIATKVAAAMHAAEHAELAAVASRDASRAADWAQTHGAPRSYGSYRELIDDPEIDAVYIPLPPSMHAEWTIRAAEAGKHVLSEKPLAESWRAAQEMADACRQNNVQLMDGVMWLHHPRAMAIRHALKKGTLGRLRRVTSAFSFNWPEVPEQDFRLQRALGGGALLDLGWYCVRAALWTFGTLPERVFGTARLYRDVDMNFSGMLWFSDERMASFDSGFDTEMRRWMEIAGTQGSLVCDDFTRPWNPDRPRFWIHATAGKVAEHIAPGPIQETSMIEAFSRSVQSGRLNDRWPQAAVATQRICEALDRSARTQRVVEIADAAEGMD